MSSARAQLCLLSGLWLVMLLPQVTLYPAFTEDEVYFKSAGFHWLKDGRWAFPEAEGFRPGSNWTERRTDDIAVVRRMPAHSPDLDEVFATYPPGYPALYACWTKLVGFGWRQSVLFDACIRLLLGLLVWHLCRLQLARLGPYALLAGAIILIQGHAGRPDEAAMVAGVAAWWVLLTRYQTQPLRATIAAGILLGLCASISQPCALVTALAAAAHVASKILTRRRALWDLALMAVVSMAVAAASWALLCLHHAGAFTQYQMASKLILGRDFFTGARMILPFWREWLLAPTFLVAGIVAAWPQFGSSRWIAMWAGPMVGLCILCRTSVWQLNYTWFCAPYLLVNVAALWHSQGQWRSARIITAVTTVLACMTLMDFASLQRHVVAARPEIKIEALDNYLANHIPSGSIVATNDPLVWYQLAPRCRLWDPFGLPNDSQISEVTHIITTRLRVNDTTTDSSMVPLWARAQLHLGHFHLVHSPERISGFPGRNFAVFERAN